MNGFGCQCKRKKNSLIFPPLSSLLPYPLSVLSNLSPLRTLLLPKVTATFPFPLRSCLSLPLHLDTLAYEDARSGGVEGGRRGGEGRRAAPLRKSLRSGTSSHAGVSSLHLRQISYIVGDVRNFYIKPKIMFRFHISKNLFVNIYDDIIYA